jgi:hypothetical protein
MMKWVLAEMDSLVEEMKACNKKARPSYRDDILARSDRGLSLECKEPTSEEIEFVVMHSI